MSKNELIRIESDGDSKENIGLTVIDNHCLKRNTIGLYLIYMICFLVLSYSVYFLVSIESPVSNKELMKRMISASDCEKSELLLNAEMSESKKIKPSDFRNAKSNCLDMLSMRSHIEIIKDSIQKKAQ